MRVPVAGVRCNTVLGDLAGSWIRPPHWSHDRDFNHGYGDVEKALTVPSPSAL